MANIVDSSVWVALFLDFDTLHAKAKREFEQLKGRIYVPYLVISEVASVLAYKHSKEQADNFLQYITHNHDLEIIAGKPQEELEFYQTLKARVSLTDAALVLLSKRLRVPLITFDKQLAGLAKKR